MNQHHALCDAYANCFSVCTCGADRPIRTLTEPVFAAEVTVYTGQGTFTVGGVREDSIKLENGTLTAESEDTRNPRLFTFQGVGGFSTILTR
jgi:hypothetical protein